MEQTENCHKYLVTTFNSWNLTWVTVARICGRPKHPDMSGKVAGGRQKLKIITVQAYPTIFCKPPLFNLVARILRYLGGFLVRDDWLTYTVATASLITRRRFIARI